MQNNTENKSKKFTIIKKIAKHGSQNIIIIPKMLEQHLKPGMTVQLGINIIENSDEIKLGVGE
ncbi:MAG: hypothetical protein Q8L27_03995 [archaeon]|nr:hypothetical protein [archaeon]